MQATEVHAFSAPEETVPAVPVRRCLPVRFSGMSQSAASKSDLLDIDRSLRSK